MKWNERSGNVLEWAMALACLFIVAVSLLLVRTAFPYELTLTVPSKKCVNVLSTIVDPGAVRGVMDGDTFGIYLFGPGGLVKIRVYEAWTPEADEPGYEEAKLFTLDWLMRGPFRVTTCGTHTFERIVAIVERNGRTLTQDLEDAGHSQKGGR